MNSELPLVDDCWNRIGVWGDGSCPELARVTHCHNCPVFARAGQRLLERCPPDEYVDEWTRRLAAGEEDGCRRLRPVVVFRVGEEWLCLDVRACVEVAPARGSHRVPHRSGKLFLGLVNIRGELHPGVSLRELLGIEPGESEAGRLLVVEVRGRRWVFAVDEVLGVQRFPADEEGAVPATVARGRAAYTRGVFDSGDRRVGLLDEERVFDALGRAIG